MYSSQWHVLIRQTLISDLSKRSNILLKAQLKSNLGGGRQPDVCFNKNFLQYFSDLSKRSNFLLKAQLKSSLGGGRQSDVCLNRTSLR